ncbi:MAG TPA: phosphoribosylformylglycinamidine synthase subunit PurQ [Alphaproteobacteria bacterium]|nr:phosphoribosylformylglycinamidine synthase subunit PurQ [Alphaproteobacteria bacterium]
MRAAVIVFPGSNCDRDVAVSLRNCSGVRVEMVWHGERVLPHVDLIAVPGGFSYGDYLRAGAMAAHSPIMDAVVAAASKGVAVLGICNGFQVLTERGLLPGTLMRNKYLKFLCRVVNLKVETKDSLFTAEFALKGVVAMPIAHNEGNYFASTDTVAKLEAEDRVVFRYCTKDGVISEGGSPNGSVESIAGILDSSRRVLGMMPHPERAADPAHISTDGQQLFESLVRHLS